MRLWSVFAAIAVVAAISGCNGKLTAKDPKQELSVIPVELPSGMSDVEIRYTITNPDKNQVTLKFPSGKQWDARVTRDGKEVFRESQGKMYTQAATSLTLKPGESKVYSTIWKLSLDPGTYEGGKYEVTAGLETKQLAALSVAVYSRGQGEQQVAPN